MVTDAPTVNDQTIGRRPGGPLEQPLLSVCLIVRDEEAALPRALASVGAVADEVVVYDTGSSDATVSVATRAGAVVVCGRWPGSFAEARNEALAHCRGRWVLSLDADEELRCDDPRALRGDLAGAPADLLALQLSIDNVTGDGLGTGYAHVAERLFRRQRCRWRGRLHEQVVDKASGQLARSAYLSSVRLAHHGYARVDAAKIERNLELARAEVADPSFGDHGLALVCLGRALSAAGRDDEALEALSVGATTTANPTARRQGLAIAVRTALGLGRLSDAAAAVRALRVASTCQILADILQAGTHLAAGQFDRALALLRPITTTVRDDDGYEHGPHSIASWYVAALVGSDRASEAVDWALEQLRLRHRLDVELDILTEAFMRSARPLQELALVIPDDMLAPVVAAAIRMEPDRAAMLLRAFWDQLVAPERSPTGDDTVPELSAPGGAEPIPTPSELTVLAGGAMLGRLLEPGDARWWSARLRHRGLEALCPLVAVAADPSVPPRRRLEAAVTAATEFGDDRAVAAFVDAVGAAPRSTDEDRVLGELPPSLRGALPRAVARARADVRRRKPASEACAVLEACTVSLVVVATGGAPRVLGCLQALAGSLPDSVPFEVIVVDPGSTDGTAEMVDGIDGDVVILRTEAAIGKAKAMNMAAEEARGDTVVFVDSSARPVAGWLPALLQTFGTGDDVGAVFPAVATASGTPRCAEVGLTPNPTGRRWVAGVPWCPQGAPAEQPNMSIEALGPDRAENPLHGRCDLARHDPRAQHVVRAASSPILAVRRAALIDVGGVDEAYWGGGEDVDLCLRLRQRGWTLVCQPDTAVRTEVPDHGWSPRWATADRRAMAFVDGVGLYWQALDNSRRLASQWSAT